jgi:hypothetical protein
MEQLPDLEKARETLKQLRQYLNEGMLLHGSKVRTEVIEPRQSSDNNPDRIIGKSFAIYAETEDVRIPILMALFDKKDKDLADCRTSYSSHGPNEPMLVSGENFTFSPGYVYVLPPEKFTTEETETEREYIATEPIKPIAVLEINPLILSLFDNIKIKTD